MRVAYISASIRSDDGWGRYTRELVRCAIDLGIEPLLIVPRHQRDVDPPPGARLQACLPEVYAIDRWDRMLRAWLRLVPLLRGCDVIHCVAEPYAPLALLLSAGRRLVISGIGTYLLRPLEGERRNRLFRAALRRADAIPCISRYTRDALLERLPELGNTCVINPGVDIERFHRSLPGPPERPRRILSLGHLKERKGFEHTLRAFARVSERMSDAELLIAGSTVRASYPDELRALARDLGVEDRVSIRPDVPDEEIVALFQSAHVFALMSINHRGTFEGYGMVFAEAAACGVPGVGSLGCGAEDAIVHGETGLLVKQGDVEGYAEALLRILGDPELRQRMADRAHELAQRRDWRQAARRLFGLYGVDVRPFAASG